MSELLSTFASSQRNKPLSVAVAIFALFAPSSLIIFLCQPLLFERLGVNGVLLISLAISLPILLLCFGLWWTPLTNIRILQQIKRDGPPKYDNIEAAVTADDPLEWPCLLNGGWTANAVLFSVAAIAYYRPLRIGATFLLVASLLLGVWVLVFLLSSWAHISLSKAIRERAVEPGPNAS